MKWSIKDDKIVFNCGCTFPILGEYKDGEMPPTEINLNNIPDCKETWHMVQDGLVKGVFQLETQLGKTWAQKTKPNCLNDMSALGAVLRPGTLEARDEVSGKSMTELYSLRKTGLIDYVKEDGILGQILHETYGILVYQEQAIKICVEIAKFDPKEADNARKTIGKKIAEEMSKLENRFIAGAKEIGIISEERAKTLFENIRASQRYSFNKSHAYSYGIIGYQTAYTKRHFPTQFFTAWLAWAKEKMDSEQETSDLIMEAKLFNIDVLPPKFEDFKADTYNDGKTIYLGLTEIKGVGVKLLDKIRENIALIDINSMTIDQIIINSPKFISHSCLEKIICAGAMSKWTNQRRKTVDKLNKFYMLTDKEQVWCMEYIKTDPKATFLEVLEKCAFTKKNGGGCHTAKKVEFVKELINTLKNPASSLDDSDFFVYNAEKNAFGVPLTVSKIDTVNAVDVAHTCKDFVNGKLKEYIINAEIVDFREHKIKRGQNAGQSMCFMSLKDGTAKIDNITVFSEAYAQYKDLIDNGNIVIVKGYVDSKNNNKSLIVENIFKGVKDE